MMECLDQIYIPSRLGFDYTNGTQKVLGDDFSLECPLCAHPNAHQLTSHHFIAEPAIIENQCTVEPP